MRKKILYNRGQVIILNTILFLAISLLIINGIGYPVISHYANTQASISSKQAFLLADSAVNEALYRLKNSKQIAPSFNLTLGSSTATIAVTNTSTGKRVTITSPTDLYQRNIQMDLTLGTGVSFHYGIQSGEGGFVLNNSSSVTGNVFSNGTVTGAGNTINGDVISAGPTGLISGINATGTLYAHTLQNSSSGKDAYYYSAATIDSYTSSHVPGTKYPNSPDQGSIDLPITDAQIAQWESDAAAGGTNNCTGIYTIKNTSVTLTAQKITCDLDIKGSTVTVSGPIWVTGNITVETGSTIQMASTLGSQNVAIVADDPSNRTTGSVISLNSGTAFQGSGSPNSFVFMISQNNSAENGGSNDAISISQSSSALVGYAIHGQISINQSAGVKEATGYKIVLSNTANVTYDRGLPSTLFQAGPGGGYNIVDWTEI
ncbi:MAG TPA: hypothetical protein VL335_01505 [Candidatus Paceibacterota bacterium]|jgi:uncharacterized protein (UPF0333 family)|nr:hypothetical protein [Candidatus Paceibacterota bacterium]